MPNRSARGPTRPARARTPVRAWLLVLTLLGGLLLAACGGGDDQPAQAQPADDRAGEARTPDDSDRADPSPAPDTDPDDTPGDTLTLPRVDLGRLLVDTVGVQGHGLLPAISAEPADPAVLLTGLRQPDGAPVDSEALVARLGIDAAYQAIYSGADLERLQLLTIDLLRFDGPGGPPALLEIIRRQPLGPGERRRPPPPTLDLTPVQLTTYDAAANPGAALAEAVAGLRALALITASDDVMLRLEFSVDQAGTLPSVESLATVAAQLLGRIDQAAGPDARPPLTIGFPRVDLTPLPGRAPNDFRGYRLLESDAGATQAVLRYVNPEGDFLLALIDGFRNAAALRIRDVAILQPAGLGVFTGAATGGFQLLDVEQLPAAAFPGTLGATARWHVRVEDVELYDDVIAYRRGPVWVILQGVSPTPGATPVLDLGFLLDDLLRDLTEAP